MLPLRTACSATRIGVRPFADQDLSDVPSADRRHSARPHRSSKSKVAIQGNAIAGPTPDDARLIACVSAPVGKRVLPPLPVPEVTSSASIKLNIRPSLSTHTEALFLSLGQFPQVVRAHTDKAVRRNTFAWRFCSFATKDSLQNIHRLVELG